MMGTILQIGLFSFLFIYAVHTLFIYLTETLTTTKVKNYEASNTYQSILDTLKHQPKMTQPNATDISDLPSGVTPLTNLFLNESSISYDDNKSKEDDAPNKKNNTMKDELKNFMKQQMN